MPTTEWTVESGGDSGETITDEFAALVAEAQAARDKAQEWAVNPEDAPVETVPDQFSSLHWATKALAYRNESLTFRDGSEAAQEAAEAAEAAAEAAAASADAAADTAETAAGSINFKAVADLTALAALDAVQWQAAIVQASGSTYVWTPGDWSAQVTALDPRYAAPDTDATGASGAWVIAAPDQTGVEGTNGWFKAKSPQIIRRAAPRFLTPEMYIGLETQIVYCPPQDPASGDPYDGGTDFAPAFAALHAELLSLKQVSQWEATGYFPAGIALQPGQRYRTTASFPLYDTEAQGLLFQGNNASIVADYAGGNAVLDCGGAERVTIRDLRIESDSHNIPSIGILFARPGTGTAERNQLHNVTVEGWFGQTGVYNYASELFRADCLTVYNYNAGASCVHLDVENEIDVAQYTGATITNAVGQDRSFNSVYMTQADLRCVQGHDKGPLRLNSTFGALENKARTWEFHDLYVTNNNALADGANRPGIYARGNFDVLVLNQHAEPYVGIDKVRLSHNLLIDNTDGAVKMKGLTLRDHLSDAQTAIIDAVGTANTVTITGAEISVHDNRGRNMANVAAPLFGPNSTTTSVRGLFRLSENSAGNSFSSVARVEGHILSAAPRSSINLPSAGTSGPLISASDSNSFSAMGTLNHTTPDNATVAVAGYDIVRVTGATVNTIAGFSDVTQPRVFYLVNGRGVSITVNGLQGGTIVLAAGTILPILAAYGLFTPAR